MWTIAIILELGMLSIFDIRRKCLPVMGLILLFVTVLIRQFFSHVTFREYMACILVGGVFILISKLSKEALGYGDSLVILALGIQLGFWGFMESLAYSMFLLGVVSLIFLVLKGKGNDRRLSIPFVPILTVGYLLAVYT